MNIRDLFLVLTGVLLNAVGQLFLKAGAKGIEGIDLSLQNAGLISAGIIHNPSILGGVVCYGISVIVWVLALSRVEVSVAYPMLSLGYIFNAVAAWWLFGENLSLMRMSGLLVIFIGVWIVARS